MGKGARLFIGIMICIFSITGVSISMATDKMFVCDLVSNKLGPKPADTEAIGSAIFQLDESGKELTYKLMVEKIEDLYMAHLHVGPSDRQGQLAVWLYPVEEHDAADRVIEGEFSGTLAEGVISSENLKGDITFEELLASLDNGNAYVNVHTRKFVTGAIRGQAHTEDYASYVQRMSTAARPAK